MPCFDERNTYEYGRQEAQENLSRVVAERDRAEAILCGILTAHPGAFEGVNWKEVGLERWVAEEWWLRHQRKDKRRKQKRKK